MAEESSTRFPGRRDPACPLDPPPEYAAMRKEPALPSVTLWDGTTAHLVTRHAEVRAVLTDLQLSSDPAKPGFPQHTPASQELQTRFLSKLDAPEHTTIRRMLQPAFTAHRMNALESALERIVTDVLADIATRPAPVDLVEEFALLVPTVGICEILGVPVGDRRLFHESVSICFDLDSSQADGRAANDRLNSYLDDLIATREREPADDLLSQLLAEHVATGALTREDLIHQSRFLIAAGFDTTGNTIALGTVLLLRHPDQLAQLRSDPALWPKAVDEILRFTSVTHSGRRRACTADLTIGQQQVHAGEGVIAAQDAANRDPDVFADPDVFDIHRDARKHVAYGFGPHRCLGAPLANIEIRVALKLLFERFPDLHLAVPFSELPFKHDSQIFGLTALPVGW